MTMSTMHPLALAYLERLSQAAGRLTPSRREELLEEIEAHLIETIPPAATDAEALTALDRLGDPEEIVEADAPLHVSPAPAPARGFQEWAAVILLLAGGIVFVGWFVGALLLWTSRAWTLRDKLIGTFIVPGGLMLPFVAMAWSVGPGETCVQNNDGPLRCTGGPSDLEQIAGPALLIFLLVAPLITAVYLTVRAGRTRQSAT